jgi:hypothetical protein
MMGIFLAEGISPKRSRAEPEKNLGICRYILKIDQTEQVVRKLDRAGLMQANFLRFWGIFFFFRDQTD